MQYAADTAILIFSRTAREEALCKSFTREERKNVRLAAHLIRFTERAAALSGLPVIKRYSGHQRGNSFGERFANAIEDVFAQGYRRIITLGTDAPDISAVVIRRLYAAMQQGAMAIGPSPDGGVYAIGISYKAWARERFMQIAWQTDAVLEDIAGYASACGQAFKVLPILRDLDSRADFEAWLGTTNKRNPFVRLLSAIAGLYRASAHPEFLIKPELRVFTLLRRGPPAVA